MAVNIYKNDFGYFSIVADDDIFNKIISDYTAVKTYFFMTKGQITTAGTIFLDFFPTSDIYITACINDPDIDSDTMNAVSSFFPNTDVKVLSDVTTEQLDRYFEFDTAHSSYVNYYMEKEAYPRYLTVKGGLKVDDDVLASSLHFPYGVYTSTTLKSSAKQDRLAIKLIVSTEDMTNFNVCSILIQNYSGDGVRVDFTRFTVSDLDNEFYTKFFANLQPTENDPYSKGGTSGEGGGTGDFDGTSDDIAIPELPTLSATSTNFITLFNPSLGELQNLANYMWSDLFDLDTFKKIFADPMDCILGLSIVPVAVPSGGSKAVTVGNISTGVTMQVASAQYVSVDCGTLNVNEYWGAYLDYDPYTKAEIYLPYIGTHPIAVDDIMGKSVHVVYHVDILSGACTAYVQCGGSVLYSFIGQCSASIPITGNDWTNVINGVLSIAGSIGSMVATGGMSAPLAVTAGASLASTAINSMKPSVEKSGSMSGVGGMLAVQTPYIILTRPRQARTKQQNTYTGYPSFITSELSKLTGYTEIEVIHMDGLTCTDSEAVEIENLLKGGVIF